MPFEVRQARDVDEGAPRRGARDDPEVLAAAVSKGNPEATRRFVEAVGGTILDAVRLVLGPAHSDLEEVTERALIRLIEEMGRFQGQGSVARFAGRMAVVTAMAYRRRQMAQVRLRAAPDAHGEGVAPALHTASQRDDARRRRDAIRELLDEVPETIGETMALRFMLCYSIDEIAWASDVSVEQVRSRLRTGNEHLRHKLERLSRP